MFPSLTKCIYRFEAPLTGYFSNSVIKCRYTRRILNTPKNIYPTYSPVVQLHTSSVDNTFWEKSRKGGYETKRKEKLSTIEQLRHGFKELKKEIGVWKNEVVERLEADPFLIFRPGETDIVWVFDDESKLKKWVTTSDSDHGEGFSKCSFEMSKSGRALFSGVLDRRVPKDGKMKKAGYCALRSMRHQKSFKRDSYLDWTQYNTLVLKVRGDGRSYLINIASEGYFDLLWNDLYTFVLYTRGGPYWQIARIPFSKFFLASKGKIQDRQNSVELDKISHFGFAAGDKVDGPFSLEIEYIGLEYDPLHEEETAYEKYRTEKFIAGV